MKQFIYGSILFIFLIVPPVAELMESIMIIHMHMQMPLLVCAGFLMARLLQTKIPRFFATWNSNGVPGIILFMIIAAYWMIPRTMDEALMLPAMEWFKFISLTFLAGVPLRDSWSKLSANWKSIVLYSFTIMFIGMGWLYISAPIQLCNNYLLIEQMTLGWGFLTTAICMVIYLIYDLFADRTEYD